MYTLYIYIISIYPQYIPIPVGKVTRESTASGPSPSIAAALWSSKASICRSASTTCAGKDRGDRKAGGRMVFYGILMEHNGILWNFNGI